jgi:5-(carboxyamino)imidazole ribonucleotide synthase
VVPFARVTSAAEAESAFAQFSRQAVLKTAGFGYDGRGQALVKNAQEAGSAFAALATPEAILEQFISFEKEISVIGARSASGQFIAYGPVENEHQRHILDLSFAPARIHWALAEEAVDLTRAIMEKLDVVGLLCVEMFLSQDEVLLVNELAPRPHNSGHYSIEGCPTSQFEQLARILAGLPLGASEVKCGVAMANLLGDIWQEGTPDWSAALAFPDLHLHLYGKTEARSGRKRGHLTALAAYADEAVDTVLAARAKLGKAVQSAP